MTNPEELYNLQIDHMEKFGEGFPTFGLDDAAQDQIVVEVKKALKGERGVVTMLDIPNYDVESDY